MRPEHVLAVVVLASVGWATRARAEGEPAPAPARSVPTLFVTCPQECFDDYLKGELSYFDFAREPHLADFALSVVRQRSGSGGERFTVAIRPQHRPSASAVPLSRAVFTPSDATPHEQRAMLAQLILHMLQEELRGTPHEHAFVLALPKRDGEALSALVDPWDYWVLAPQLNGGGEGGSGYYFADFMGALNVRRITEASKVRVRGGYGRRLSGYRLEDGSRIVGDVSFWDARGLVAGSIGRHFALGNSVVAGADEFENLEGHVHGGFLAEMNVFPYVDNARQQLRLAYQLGTWANFYLEENVDGVMRELRPYNALSLIADINQGFGSVQFVGQVNAFLDDPSLYRLSVGAVVSLRVMGGLSMGLQGKAALVEDLINLRKRQITDEELLLWTAQQATDFTAEAVFALTYTFGSVHNTIVNPRFGRVDLEED